MSPFITFREKDDNGDIQYYILQREFPHYLGRIYPYQLINVICQSPVSGHNLWVVFCGTLIGRYIPMLRGEAENIQIVFDNMASWFYSERVAADPNKYKKFKIVSQ